MDEKMKNRIMLVLGILCAIFLLSTVNSCTALRHQKARWRKEMAQRLESEEKANKFMQGEAALEQKLRKSDEALQEKSKVLDAAEKALAQERVVCQNLRAELDKLNRLKEALEQDLKEALAAAKPVQAKPGKK